MNNTIRNGHWISSDATDDEYLYLVIKLRNKITCNLLLPNIAYTAKHKRQALVYDL